MFMYFPLILLIVCIKIDFYGFTNPWDHFDPVRIEHSSKLPQDLRQIVEYVAGNGSHTFEKITFNTFVKKRTCIMGLWETSWGKMTVMTVGSFQVFIKNVTLTCVFQVEVHVFPKTSICILSV